MLRLVLAPIALVACVACTGPSRSERAVVEPIVDAAVRLEPAVSAAPAPISDAGVAAPFRVGAGVDADEEIIALAELTDKASQLCATFLKKANSDAAEVAKSFSFQQRTPSCTLQPAPSVFRPNGTFLDARVLRVNHVSRQQRLLALQLARGWVISWIAWDVDDSESAIPLWSTRAPERIEADGARLLVYLPGGDVANDRGPNDKRLLRGAFACTDDGTTLACAKWDPTVRAPLGSKTAKGADPRWSSVPWSAPQDLVWRPDGSLVPIPAP